MLEPTAMAPMLVLEFIIVANNNAENCPISFYLLLLYLILFP